VQVGIEVVPVAWWEYVNWRAARHGQRPVPFDKDALWHQIRFAESRNRPSPSFYHMRLDPAAYPATVTLPEEVERASAVLCAAAGVLARTAIDLVQPGRYLEELLADPDKGVGIWEPLVVLLAERGPSTDLDEAIDEMRISYAEHGANPPDSIVEYARMRASVTGHVS